MEPPSSPQDEGMDDTQLTTTGPSIIESKSKTTGLALTACNFTGPLKKCTTTDQAIEVMRGLTEEERVKNVHQVLQIGEQYTDLVQVGTFHTVQNVIGIFKDLMSFKNLKLAKNYLRLYEMSS
jgi:hypothetical protein